MIDLGASVVEEAQGNVSALKCINQDMNWRGD